MASSNVGATSIARQGDTRSNGYSRHISAEYSEDLIALSDEGTQGEQRTTTSGEQQGAQMNLPAWFSSDSRPLGAKGDGTEHSDLEVNRQKEAATRAPEPPVVENSTQVGPQLDEDGSVRDRLLQNYVLDDVESSKLESGGHPGMFKLTGSRVQKLSSCSIMILTRLGPCQASAQTQRARYRGAPTRSRSPKKHIRSLHAQALRIA